MTLFDIDQKYEVIFDEDTISDGGRQEIENWIASQNMRDTRWAKFLPDDYDPFFIGKRFLPALPSDWVWRRNYVPSDKRDPVRGYFVRRMEQYYHNVHDFKGLPEFFKENVGTMVDKYVNLESSHVIKITQNLQWTAGDFGDGRSCFWTSNKNARFFLQRMGAYAVQAFRHEDQNTGLGRCWMIPDYPVKGAFCLFNGYGYAEGSDALRILAKVFARLINGDQKKVTLKNKNSNTGLLYINGGRAAIVATPDIIKGVKEDSTYDLDWDVNPLANCKVSGEPIWSMDDYIELSNGEMVLSKFADKIFTCPFDDCGRTFVKERHGVIVRSNAFPDADHHDENYIYICRDCSSRHTITDELTGLNILDVDGIFVNGEGIVTHRDTFFETCGICTSTGLAFLKQNLIRLDNHNIVSIGAYYHLKTSFKLLLQNDEIFTAFRDNAEAVLGASSASSPDELVSFINGNVFDDEPTQTYLKIFDSSYLEARAYLNNYEVSYA